MLFADKNKVWYTLSSYTKDTKMVSAEISKIIIDSNVFPEDASAIGENKQIIIQKLFSEYYERRAMGFNTFKIGNTWCLSKNKVVLTNRNDVGYGWSNKFGILDTTGSAAGISSTLLKNKALSELLEKNESLIFWYTDLFEKVKLDSYMLNLIKLIGLSKLDLSIFHCSELSNAHTIIVICFNHNKLVSSGISCSLSYLKAFKQALLESKMILFAYYGRSFIPIPQLNNVQYQEQVYNFIKNKERNAPFLKKESTKDTKLVLAEWIGGVSYSGIDVLPYSQIKGIRCSSRNLLNCMPYLENLKKMPNKCIIKKYEIIKKINTVPMYSLF